MRIYVWAKRAGRKSQAYFYGRIIKEFKTTIHFITESGSKIIIQRKDIITIENPEE